MDRQHATFAAGCFWGVQETLRKIPGVLETQAGYSGGTVDHPTYEQVCTGRTGHAEAVEVIFDPQQVTYEQLLNVFFENHDPTTPNRQGPDVGTQYRSVIFVHDPAQRREAEAEIARRNASGEYALPLVTTVEKFAQFWPAEDYHQFYFQQRNVNWSCHFGNGKLRK